MHVKEMMTVDPVCVTADATLSQVATLMVEHNCGAILVVDDLKRRRVVGIVTDRDIVCRSVARGDNTPTRSVASTMSSPVATVSLDTSAERCCEVMQEHQYRRVAVVDAEDRCLGIVAQADLARYAKPELVAETLRHISLDSPGGLA